MNHYEMRLYLLYKYRMASTHCEGVIDEGVTVTLGEELADIPATHLSYQPE